MAKVNSLSRLKIREVSSVDRPANPGARILLMKRQLPEEHADSGGRRPGRRGVAPRTLFAHQAAARAAYMPGPKLTKPKSKPDSVDRPDKMEKPVKSKPKKTAKRQFTAEERRTAAASGHAMPGGGYPINTVDDLHNAIQAVGRAKNPGKTRSHIRTQAARLGRTDLIPEDWGKTMKRGKKPAFAGAAKPFGATDEPPKKAVKARLKTAKYIGAVARITKDAVSFDQMLAEMSSTDYAEGVIEAVRDACHALKDAVESISECDDLPPDEKGAAIKESFGQFLEHLSGIDPNVTKSIMRGAKPMKSLQKRLAKAFTSVPQHDPTPPTKAKDVKDDKDADENIAVVPPVKTATSKKLKKAIGRLEDDVKLWKRRALSALTMEKAAKDYMDDPDADMDEDKKTKFLDMSPKDRLKFIEANPLAKIAEKRMANLPEPVRKQLEEGKTAAAEVAKMTERNEVVEFSKRAIDLGQPAAFGAHLRVLAKAIGTAEERQKAYDEVVKAIESYAAQARTAGLFKEFGSSSFQTGTAAEELAAKAETLRGEVNKTLSGGARPMTKEQAFEKVYTDPANVDLVGRYKAEQRRAA